MADRLTSARGRQLADALARLQVRIAAAGGRLEHVTVVAVCKGFPASDVRELAALGVHDVGENRDQEAGRKRAELGDLSLRWHFVGRLQTNKAASVAAYAHLVHSVDRAGVVAALDRGAARVGRTLDVLVQLSIDGDRRRGGAPVAELPRLAAVVAASPHLRLAGVMAVAPPAADPERAFGTLAAVATDLRARYPAATVLSAGMSGDLEAAVRHGATHLRIGTALLGSRPPEVR